MCRCRFHGDDCAGWSFITAWFLIIFCCPCTLVFLRVMEFFTVVFRRDNTPDLSDALDELEDSPEPIIPRRQISQRINSRDLWDRRVPSQVKFKKPERLQHRIKDPITLRNYRQRMSRIVDKAVLDSKLANEKWNNEMLT